MGKSPSETPAPIETGIHTLPHELLLDILTMNNDMFSNPKALTNTRHASQVCQEWREILLDCPSLWGRLIDLDVFWPGTVPDHWINEVLRRSQGALLWIGGGVVGNAEDPTPVWKFFMSLLSNHWTRIQKIAVEVDRIDEHDPRWEMMFQPAPHLEVFEVGLWSDLNEDKFLFSPSRKDSTGLPVDLFANHAPFLRKFHTRQISISLHAPWLHNLHSIFLAFPFTLEQAFQVLQCTPLLESLAFDSLSYDEPLSLPQLTLSHLTKLGISECLEVCNLILTHLTPTPGCSLSLNAVNITLEDANVDQTLSEAYQPLSKYLKNFYQTHTATHVALNCLSTKFSFIDRNYPSGDYCTIDFDFGPESLAPELTAFITLLSAFTTNPTPFLSVQRLNLYLHVPAALNTTYTLILSASSFPAVQVLDTLEYCLISFLQHKDKDHGSLAPSSQPIPFPFPALKTLKLTKIAKPKSLESVRASPLILFLNACQLDLCPIKVLELYLSRDNASPGYLRHFGPILDQEMVGMTVRVLSTERAEVFEAVCGGDNVQQIFSR